MWGSLRDWKDSPFRVATPTGLLHPTGKRKERRGGKKEAMLLWREAACMCGVERWSIA